MNVTTVTMEDLKQQILHLEKRLDEHKAVHESSQRQMQEIYEKITQNLGDLRSDVKSIQLRFNEYITKVESLELDKKKKDGWIEWFQKSILQIIILAFAIAIGIKLK